ncbi:MAG: SufD family Fe-S cluster assembly protein [bacterium]|nr:SufD family Fe-S cluster assembly protein [bacterium]
MNKILVDNKKDNPFQSCWVSNNKMVIQEDQHVTLELSLLPSFLEIIVSKGITCEITFSGVQLNSHVSFLLEESSSVKLQGFIMNGQGSVTASLVGKYSLFSSRLSFLCDQNSKIGVSIYHKNSESKSYSYLHGISLRHSDIHFSVNGYVEKESSQCVCVQDSKIIYFEDSKSQIDPNLYIENYDVEASHAAYVGSFSKQELFYLMSRGLTYQDSCSLLIYSFLMAKMDLEKVIREQWMAKMDLMLKE